MILGKVILHHVSTPSQKERTSEGEPIYFIIVVVVCIISLSLLIQMPNKNLSSSILVPCTRLMRFTGDDDDDDDEYDELCLCEKLVDGF
jgi:hypothetical protein